MAKTTSNRGGHNAAEAMDWIEAMRLIDRLHDDGCLCYLSYPIFFIFFAKFIVCFDALDKNSMNYVQIRLDEFKIALK